MRAYGRSQSVRNGKGKPLIRGKLSREECLINEPSTETAWMECLIVLGKEAQWSGATSKRICAAGSRYPSLSLPPCDFLFEKEFELFRVFHK